MGLIMDPFRDECFTAALGAGAFLNGDAITVGDAAVVSDAVVCTGYGSTGSAGPMLRGTCVCVCVSWSAHCRRQSQGCHARIRRGSSSPGVR